MSALTPDGNHAVPQITTAACLGRAGASVLLLCLGWSGWIKVGKEGGFLNDTQGCVSSGEKMFVWF